MTLVVACVNAGNYLGRGVEYVNILWDMVSRNLPSGFPGEFHVFTDTPGDYHPNIHVNPLPEPGIEGWYNKISLFKPGVFGPDDRILFLDLDSLITGRLDELVELVRSIDDGLLVIVKDLFDRDHNNVQSCVMAWRGGFMDHIWTKWVEQGRPDVPGGDQAWIGQAHNRFLFLQDRLPNLLISYKERGGRLPKVASIVAFHGKPRPHEVKGWAAEVWKIGGLMRADLDEICNTETRKLLDNVRANIKSPVPRLQWQAGHDRSVCIIGGGPSVRGRVEEIKLRKSWGERIWALNGSARWLQDNGIIPDAQIIVDARPENLRFVMEAHHPWMEYFLASQVDPILWSAASPGKAMMWHCQCDGVEPLLVNEPPGEVPIIGGGSTVGLCAMSIAYVMGFRMLHLFGYDSSFEDDHHAYPQAGNDDDLVFEAVTEDGARFKCAAWMVGQAEQFVQLAAELAEKDVTITVAGTGLIPHLARAMMETPPVRAADVRASEILRRLPPGDVAVAELGVFTGELSRRLLARPDLHLDMVDAYDPAVYTDVFDFHANVTLERAEEAMRSAKTVADDHRERAYLFRETTRDFLAGTPDEIYDLVFVDADHSYEACMADLERSWSKVKAGGYLGGHDYGVEDIHPGFGVTRAADEFASRLGLPLEVGENATYFIRRPQ